MSEIDYDKIAKMLGVNVSESNEQLDYDKIAKMLGAERRGKIGEVKGGYFGAMQLAAEVSARFKTPPTGGRATDPNWTERRLVPLTATTLKRLEELAAQLREKGVSIETMQLAALLLERASTQTSEELSKELIEQLKEPR
jgi:hypothetical protein